jgi:hypothetical protein
MSKEELLEVPRPTLFQRLTEEEKSGEYYGVTEKAIKRMRMYNG